MLNLGIQEYKYYQISINIRLLIQILFINQIIFLNEHNNNNHLK